LCGYSYNPKSTSLSPAQKALVDTQDAPKNIESDTNFKDLTKMW